jgi:hypothetical protein
MTIFLCAGTHLILPEMDGNTAEDSVVLNTSRDSDGASVTDDERLERRMRRAVLDPSYMDGIFSYDEPNRVLLRKGRKPSEKPSFHVPVNNIVKKVEINILKAGVSANPSGAGPSTDTPSNPRGGGGGSSKPNGGGSLCGHCEEENGAYRAVKALRRSCMYNHRPVVGGGGGGPEIAGSLVGSLSEGNNVGRIGLCHVRSVLVKKQNMSLSFIHVSMSCKNCQGRGVICSHGAPVFGDGIKDTSLIRAVLELNEWLGIPGENFSKNAWGVLTEGIILEKVHGLFVSETFRHPMTLKGSAQTRSWVSSGGASPSGVRPCSPEMEKLIVHKLVCDLNANFHVGLCTDPITVPDPDCSGPVNRKPKFVAVATAMSMGKEEDAVSTTDPELPLPTCTCLN